MAWKLVEEKRGKKGRALATEYDAFCIYLYYVKLNEKNETEVSRSYFYYDFVEKPISAGDVKNQITTLAINGLNNGTEPPSHGSKISDMIWRRKGYFVIAVDGGTRTLNAQNPLRIDGRAESIGNDGMHTFKYLEAFSFMVRADDGKEKRIQTVFAYNDMQKFDPRRDLGENEYEYFSFTLNFDQQARLEPFFLPDSGGTNLGPPCPPPALLYLFDAADS